MLACASPASAADLTSAVIRGSTVYTAPELFALYREQLGKPLTRDSARAIVTELVERYEADGYSRPQVRVDAALSEAGILRVDVFEARFAEVEINGDPGPHLARLEALGDELLAAGVVQQSAVQSTLRSMRDLPGLSLSATTEPESEGLNVYRLELETEFEPVSGAVRISNRGTEEVGPRFVLGQVMANGLLGGKTSLGAMFGAATDYDEYRGLGFLANVGIGDRGLHAATSAFRSRSQPYEPGLDSDDSYVRDRVTVRFSRRLEESPWSLSAGLELDDLAVVHQGTLLRDERLRMLELGSVWNRRAARTQLQASLELVKGLDGLGSGLTALDLPNDPRRADFVLTRSSFTRLTRFGERWSMRLDLLAQATSYVLPYNERFKIGGDRIGRGFEVPEIAGDQGLGAKLEGRRQLPGAPSALGRTSVYGFYDIGAAWRQEVSGRESAATAGFGFATQHARASASLELAKPLTRPDGEGNRDLNLFVEITVSL
jgi:hemolysin activation/secretion protein